MFGIGSAELLVIIIVAFLVLGPSHLPKIARTLGKTMGEFRRVSTEFQRTLNLEMEKEEHEDRKRQAEKEFFPQAAQAENAAEAKTDVEKAVDAAGRASHSREQA
jgi:sec-independent protein translocase protein TatB